MWNKIQVYCSDCLINHAVNTIRKLFPDGSNYCTITKYMFQSFGKLLTKITQWRQLILFALVPFLHHVCHTWPNVLPLKMTMSVSTFCKFCTLDKSVIAIQCNCIAAEIVTSHASWSFLFWKFWQDACNFSLWSGGSFAHIWHDLMDVWVIIWLWWDRTCRTCSITVSFVLKSVVDMLKMWVHKRTRAENNPSNHYPNKSW